MPKCRVSTRNLISLFFFSCKEKHWNPICSFSERGIFCLFPFFLNAFGLLKYYYNIYPPCHCNNEDGQTSLQLENGLMSTFWNHSLDYSDIFGGDLANELHLYQKVPGGKGYNILRFSHYFLFLCTPKLFSFPQTIAGQGSGALSHPHTLSAWCFCND